MATTHPVLDAVDKGEPLVRVTDHHLFRVTGLHKSTVIRWCIKGMLPTLRIGRSFYTTESMIRDFILDPNRSHDRPTHNSGAFTSSAIDDVVKAAVKKSKK